MAWPTDFGTIPANAQGNTLVADIADDHALAHRQIGSILNSAGSKLGLSAGTPAVNQILTGGGNGSAAWGTSGTLLNFASSNFNNGTLGTNLYQGGTHNNGVFGTPTLTLGSDAQGDIFYRSSAGTLTRLAPGTSGQYLQTNGSSANPSWTNVSASSDGWTASSDTLVYASASSFTIAGVDRTTTYTKGTRVKFTNNATTYYGVVASSVFSTNTTVTLIANNDYAIANSAITAPSYSYQLSPQGYPTWFAYTPTISATSPMTYSGAIDVARFMVNGKTCTVNVSTQNATTGGSASNALTFTVPVAAVNQSINADAPSAGCWVVDVTGIGGVAVWSSSTVVQCRRYDSANFTLATNRRFSCVLTYEF